MLHKMIPSLALAGMLAASSSTTSTGASAAEAQQANLRQVAEFGAELSESSGLASHRDSLWTINDSGAAPLVYQLDANGRLIESFLLPGISNRDWESLASDNDYLYIADTGNNINNRDSLLIYRVAWEELGAANPTIDQIEFRFGDYRAGNAFRHNFDAEALAVKGEELWLFSKNRGDLATNLYRFPKQPGSYAPLPSQSLEVNSLVTAADIHPQTGELLLIGFRLGERDRLWRIPTSQAGVDWQSRKLFAIGPVDQWEAVAWDTERDRILLTHENNTRGFAGLAQFED